MEDWRRLISDPTVPAEVLITLASQPTVDPAALEALAVDQGRLSQAPAIATAIYRNPAASLSVANRAVVTCLRAGVVAEGIPAFAELAQAIAADPEALNPAAADTNFQALLGAAAGESADLLAEDEAPGQDDGADDGAAKSEAPTGGAPAAAPRSQTRRSARIDFSRLKLYEKIRLATLGNAFCRQNLLRDSNRMVALAAIRSPQITDGEVAKAAANRALSEDVIRYISNRKELVKQYAVKLALVGNAKCPLAVALRLLGTLHAEDIKQIARSKNVPGALSVAAKKLAATRGPQ